MTINVKVARKWTVEFVVQKPLELFPVPARIVQEREGAGYQIIGTPPPFNQHLHGGQLTITTGGRGQLRTADKSYDLHPGSAFLYRIADPDVSYYYPAGAQEPWEFLWMHFDGGAAEELIAELNRKYGYVFDVAGNEALWNRLVSFRSSAGQSFLLYPLEAAKLSIDIFELLCQKVEQRDAVEPAALLTLQVQRLVAENLSQPLHAGRIARELGVSREHLCKIFKARTNQTLHEYCIQKRLEAAIQLLSRTTLNCKEIVTRCGFGSYSSFFRNFQQYYGQSPECVRHSRFR